MQRIVCLEVHPNPSPPAESLGGPFISRSGTFWPQQPMENDETWRYFRPNKNGGFVVFVTPKNEGCVGSHQMFPGWPSKEIPDPPHQPTSPPAQHPRTRTWRSAFLFSSTFFWAWCRDDQPLIHLTFNSSPVKMVVSNRNLLFPGPLFSGSMFASGRVPTRC